MLRVEDKAERRNSKGRELGRKKDHTGPRTQDGRAVEDREKTERPCYSSTGL